MNWIVVLGIVLIGVGSYLTYYGGWIHNKNESEEANDKLNEIARNVAELKGRPMSELTEESIINIENDVEEWVYNFSRNKDRKDKIFRAKEEERLSALEHSDNLVKGYFSFLISLIEKAVETYPMTSRLKEKTNIPEIPNYLFTNPNISYQAEIYFSDTYRWEIRAYSIDHFQQKLGRTHIIFSMQKVSSSVPSNEESGHLRIRFYSDAQQFHFAATGEAALAINKSSDTLKSKDFEVTAKDLVKTLFERQILIAENQ